MAWLWTHLITWVVIAVLVAIVLLGNSKYDRIYQMIVRLGYLVSIISGLMLFEYGWHRDPIFTTLKIVVALAFIALVEIGFARKKNGQLSNSTIYTVFAFCIVVGVLGFILAGGRPFV
ncbi:MULTISPECIES: DUF1516 family protein [Lactobacillaceae]|uniref:DUF1516 family protein n=1 Tax=Lactobacillaceae TaxID=33958 RepID=UPI000C1B6C22|nr:MULTISPECIES: DUF1516 family protein [Lactobacillaceae]